MAFLGAELRRARVSAGLSQEQLRRELNFSGDMVGKVETSDRAASPDSRLAATTCFRTWTVSSRDCLTWLAGGKARTRNGSATG
jgi:transcriptional regulator with XRE-family HTH domain